MGKQATIKTAGGGSAPAPEKSGEERFSDEELVARIGEADDSAAEILVRRYQEKAFSIAFSMCDGDREAARDCVQDAFVKMLRNIGKYRGQSAFYTWFYRILVNTCLDRRRGVQRWRKLFFFKRENENGQEADADYIERQPDASEEANPATALNRTEFDRDLKKALKALPEKQKTVFVLKAVQEMTIPEIARVMKLAEGTVKSHLFRATRRLQEEMKSWREA